MAPQSFGPGGRPRARRRRHHQCDRLGLVGLARGDRDPRLGGRPPLGPAVVAYEVGEALRRGRRFDSQVQRLLAPPHRRLRDVGDRWGKLRARCQPVIFGNTTLLQKRDAASCDENAAKSCGRGGGTPPVRSPPVKPVLLPINQMNQMEPCGWWGVNGKKFTGEAPSQGLSYGQPKSPPPPRGRSSLQRRKESCEVDRLGC